MNESEIEEGDNLLTVFYRQFPVGKDEVPLVMQHTHFSQAKSWENLLKDADGKKSGCDIVSLTHSPKNVGSCNNQFMFYTKGSNEHGTPCFKTLRRTDGNWQDLANELRDYCNTYIPPHTLISISLYEDKHPNEDQGINACITHTAGSDP